MKRTLFAALMVFMALALTGCGDGGGSPPPAIVTQFSSDPAFDGDIAKDLTGAFTITPGMSQTVQSVFAGIDPATGREFRAFLDFPLRGVGRVPGNAIIVSATLDIVINSIKPLTGTIPIRIELVSFSSLLASDFDRVILLPLVFTTITPQINQADLGNHVPVDVTPLMAEAQFRGLEDFQIRILEDFGVVSPGLIEINDTTGADRELLAPLLEVTYF